MPIYWRQKNEHMPIKMCKLKDNHNQKIKRISHHFKNANVGNFGVFLTKENLL